MKSVFITTISVYNHNNFIGKKKKGLLWSSKRNFERPAMQALMKSFIYVSGKFLLCVQYSLQTNYFWSKEIATRMFLRCLNNFRETCLKTGIFDALPVRGNQGTGVYFRWIVSPGLIPP